MARRFEDLVVWQKAREMTRVVYAVTRQGAFCRDIGLRSQMQRAAVSVMANIAEGVERSGQNELAHFLSLAKGSCAELRSHLYVALDVGYLAPQEFEQLRDMADEIGRMINGLRQTALNARTTQR